MNLREKPFFLSELDIKWVEETYSKLSLAERIGQLFCPIGYSTNPDYIKNKLISKNIGGLFFRDGLAKQMRETFKFAQDNSKVPLLIPSNLESGGSGAALDGTPFMSQLGVAATNDKTQAYRLGKVSCKEGAALGINWAFAPVVDIDYNFRNPITNVRTFGSDPKQVIINAAEYMKAAKESGVAVSIKHFPGDGVDERDQHLLTSINSFSISQWDRTYGKVYKKLIELGALTVMVGHIALPSYQDHYDPFRKNEVVPATLSNDLLEKLLRNKLGFNGLIVTDATPMVGYTAACERNVAIPQSIEAGCDMILFNKDLDEDYAFMLDGYNRGILSEKRLKEAVYRILALKASLKLHIKKEKGNLVPEEKNLSVLRCKEHLDWANEVADRAITLVKDTKKALPISSLKYKRVLLEVLGDFDSNERVVKAIREELEKREFDVTVYEKEDFSKGVDNVTQFKNKYDLVLYIGNVENASNRTTNRINWYTFFGQGNNIPWFVKEVPTIFVSVGNPYHLFDVPMISTYVNCYSNNEFVLSNVIKKLCGESDFKGINPIDPFCNREELKY